ncbi:tRNA1(Val) (adenine(37)-N6)-methyltransferase [Helicobacter labacensis]|uniref:tRNA1(Val) (adenine(37)-N6)-methyltransferase n=1 Tax=Helicobacter labacensis TaxID=2316079 RepID=UPI001968BEB2|nr:methyltransferase [Helicobacter labacensis]
MALLRLYQPLKGYAYNSDSLFLAHFARPFIKKHAKLLDVGAGCGVVGLLCAREWSNPLDLLEIDPNLAFCAQKNSAHAPHARVICANFLQASLDTYDCILSNPPYYPQNSPQSPNPQIARATNQSFLPLDKLCARVYSLLKPQGYFILCYHASLSDALLFALQNAKLNPVSLRFVHPFAHKKATLVLCCARKSSKSLLEVQAPLITHNSKDQRDVTAEVASIYACAQTYSIKAQIG